MRLRKSVLIVLSLIFVAALNVYIFISQMWYKLPLQNKGGISDICGDPAATAPNGNPNKMLFISCGGFFD